MKLQRLEVQLTQKDLLGLFHRLTDHKYPEAKVEDVYMEKDIVILGVRVDHELYY